MLQIAVHNDGTFSGSSFETGENGRFLAEVAGKGKPFDIRFRLCEPGSVGAMCLSPVFMSTDDGI